MVNTAEILTTCPVLRANKATQIAALAKVHPQNRESSSGLHKSGLKFSLTFFITLSLPKTNLTNPRNF